MAFKPLSKDGLIERLPRYLFEDMSISLITYFAQTAQHVSFLTKVACSRVFNVYQSSHFHYAYLLKLRLVFYSQTAASRELVRPGTFFCETPRSDALFNGTSLPTHIANVLNSLQHYMYAIMNRKPETGPTGDFYKSLASLDFSQLHSLSPAPPSKSKFKQLYFLHI